MGTTEKGTRSQLPTEPLRYAAPLSGSVPGAGPGAPGQPEKLPRRAGKFDLIEKLGAGGMGEVYLARDLDSNREVAVKFIRSQIGRREAFLEFFHNREAVLARQIDHPNVIRIYEHGVIRDRHYISMEHVPGRSLHQALRERRLLPAEVLEILWQAACGLAAAHRRGVVHSDIKPANILLLGKPGGPAAGGAEPEAAVEDDSSAILLFEEETALPEARLERPERYDPALVEEIHRRIGVPTREALLDPPFFERASEMRFLEHYLERLRESRGAAILVEGEAGTGKDRLVSEFIRRQQAPAGGEAVLPVARFLELDGSRVEGLPLLHEKVFPERSASDLDPAQLAEELRRNIGETSVPTVVRLLGLGSLTPLAAHCIAGWAAHLDRAPILLLAAADPEDLRADGPLKELLPVLKPWTKELYLRPLTEYQIQRYLQQVFRDSLPGLELPRDLYRLSRGNFTRLLDILRGFFDRGLLKLDGISGRLIYRPSTREFELEEGKNLYELYRSRGTLERQILDHGAFIGPQFFFDTLLRFTQQNETALFFSLRNLVAEGFITEEERTRFRFTNRAFQRYLAERIPAAERPYLHRKVSRLLQELPVPPAAELYQLRALHHAGCREFARAVESLLEGAHLALIAYQTDLVQEMYHQILEIYRRLASHEAPRREVTGILKEWFRRDGNWYEILGRLAAEERLPRVKIADFGISFRLEDERRGLQVGKRILLGTPRYMAPERGGGERGGPRSDIFSLGIIAYEMAVGETPFPELKGWKVLEAYRHRRIRIPVKQLGDYPPGFDRLLQGMLEIHPNRRWDIDQVLRVLAHLHSSQQPGGRQAPPAP